LDFSGLAGFEMRKVFVGRSMKESEWASILQGIDSGNFVYIEGLAGKRGPFGAWIVRRDDKVYGPGFEFQFSSGKNPGNPSRVSGFVCPKSQKPVGDFGDFWIFPGWPDLKCRKVFVGRLMKESEWASILQGIESGNFFKIDGLVGKKGAFAAFIVRQDSEKFGPGFGFKF
jgi:hypothetical protein